jgi:hypothetical protein
MQEPWARASLLIRGDDRSVDDVAAVMGQATERTRKPPRNWTAGLPVKADRRLDEQLDQVREYLAERRTQLTALADCDIRVFISWAPHAPRDRVAFRPELLTLLHALRSTLVLDTSLHDEIDEDEQKTWSRVRLTTASQPQPIEIPTQQTDQLADQLLEVHQFLVERLPQLEPSAGITVAIDWAPRNPQDSIGWDLDMVAVLARLRATVAIETHIDDSSTLD